MKIGFTGTRNGMTFGQHSTFYDVMLVMPTIEEFHHGDCKGADENAHNYAVKMAEKVIVHPPINPLNRAGCTGKNQSIACVLDLTLFLLRRIIHQIVVE